MKKVEFSKALFWDTDVSKLDYEKYARYVIERVLSRGLLTDWYQLKQLYGIAKIKEEVVEIRTMDKKMLNFCCLIFDLEKTDFRCYNTKPFTQQPWNGLKS